MKLNGKFNLLEAEGEEQARGRGLKNKIRISKFETGCLEIRNSCFGFPFIRRRKWRWMPT
jgi:hypothetical protein